MWFIEWNMISIAMATYNGAKYLSEQIDSILGQTTQDFELIICDDCSTDETWSMLKDYASRDHRIKLLRNKENIGFKNNFEKVLYLCSGEYIALSDQDDIWVPNHLELLYKHIGDKMVVCGNAEMIGSGGESLGLTLQDLESFNYVPGDNMQLASSIIFFRNPFQGASMMINKSFLNHALPIPKSIKYHDSWFSNLSPFCGGIVYTTDIVNKYRMHGKNVTGMRIKPRSRVRTLVSHLLFAQTAKERKEVVMCVLDRMPNKDCAEASFLKEVLRKLKRASSIIGRIQNECYLIGHYKTLFNADSSHWF